MKTIEQIKIEFKNATGKDLPLYTYKGKLGILYECEPYHGKPDFLPMENLLQKEDLDFEKVHWIDFGEDCAEEGDEITDASIQNPEWEQGVLSAWVTTAYAKSDMYVRELLITTTDYHAWKSARKWEIDCLWRKLKDANDELEYYDEHADELDDEEKRERDRLAASLKDEIARERKSWVETCSRYENADGWELDFCYDGHTADFKSVLGEVFRPMYFNQTVCDVAKEFLKD